MNPFQFTLICLVGWLQHEQPSVIEYLQEEVRVLRELLGEKRPRFNDVQRIRLAAKAKKMKFSRLKEIGQEISRDTVANILRDHGIEPAPERRRNTTWADFLKRHWAVMAAADLLTIETWSGFGAIRYHVFFVMRLAARAVHIAGITQNPTGAWMAQTLRNLTDGMEGSLQRWEFLIQDRDPFFTVQADHALESRGIRSVRLPARSPNLKACAERFVRSIKQECPDQMVLFNEKSLRYAIAPYVEHYHCERNHQGLDSRIIRPEFDVAPDDGQIVRHKHMGGLLNYHHRRAA